MDFLGQERYYVNETYIESIVVIKNCSEHFGIFFGLKNPAIHLLQNCVVREDLQPDHLLERFYFERFLEGGQQELRPDWSERRWYQANLEITFLDKTTKNFLSLLIIWDSLWIFVHFPGEIVHSNGQ